MNPEFYSFITLKTMFSALLLDVSKHITNKSELRCLGIGLGLESNEIRTIEHNHRDDINDAGYQVLSVWREKSADKSEMEMREDLKNVLSSKRVGMHLVVSECF